MPNTNDSTLPGPIYCAHVPRLWYRFPLVAMEQSPLNKLAQFRIFWSSRSTFQQTVPNMSKRYGKSQAYVCLERICPCLLATRRENWYFSGFPSTWILPLLGIKMYSSGTSRTKRGGIGTYVDVATWNCASPAASHCRLRQSNWSEACHMPFLFTRLLSLVECCAWWESLGV